MVTKAGLTVYILPHYEIHAYSFISKVFISLITLVFPK